MRQHECNPVFDDADGIDTTDQSTEISEATVEEMRAIMARYPNKRSALMPMLHLVQSVDGRVSDTGIRVVAELLGITTAQVNGVATFYTMFKRRPAGHQHIGVCTTSLCAVMGGDILLNHVEKKLGIHEGETTSDGKFSLERVECNAACDFAPVMMVNWEYMDNMTPAKADELLDTLANDATVKSTRGATITDWRAAERVLAGYEDGLADEGPRAGESSVRGLKIAQANNWQARGQPGAKEVGK